MAARRLPRVVRDPGEATRLALELVDATDRLAVPEATGAEWAALERLLRAGADLVEVFERLGRRRGSRARAVGRPAALERTVPVLTDLDARLDAAGRALLRLATRIARRRGESVYLVGGPVRDLLRRRPVRDLDLVVVGDGPAFARELARATSGAPRVHRRFLTATVACALGWTVDVATARRERYARPAALPRIERGSLIEDLWRRDFTVNAMAFDLRRRRLVDPFGGRRDLVRRRLRIHHALSLVEDPSRALRAVRLAAAHDLRLPRALRALVRAAARAGLVSLLPPARLARELDALASGPAPARGFLLLAELDVLRDVLSRPRRARSLGRRLRQAERMAAWHRGLRDAGQVRPLLLFLLVLTEGLDRDQLQGVATALGLGRAERRLLFGAPRERRALGHRLARCLRPSAIHAACRGRPAELLLDAVGRSGSRVAHRNLARYLETLRFVRLSITGDDLRRAGVPAGPRLGWALRRTLAARLDGRVRGIASERAHALAQLRRALTAAGASGRIAPAGERGATWTRKASSGRSRSSSSESTS